MNYHRFTLHENIYRLLVYGEAERLYLYRNYFSRLEMQLQQKPNNKFINSEKSETIEYPYDKLKIILE